MALTKIYHPAVPLHSLEECGDVLRRALASLHMSAITVSSGDLGIRITVQSRGGQRELHVSKYTFDWPVRKDNAVREVPGPSQRVPEVGNEPGQAVEGQLSWDDIPAEYPEEETPPSEA